MSKIMMGNKNYKMGEEHWNWKGGIYINPHSGYCYYSTAENRDKLVHRVVWEEHFGKIPERYEIHHKNKNKQDNRIENLQLLPRGEQLRRFHRKVDDEKFEQAKQLRQKGKTTKQIAELLGVSETTIGAHLLHC